MDDSRARFLSAISQRLGADRIVELHLFSPIRQGVLETGVAVIATTPDEEGEGSRVWEGKENGMGTGDEPASAEASGRVEVRSPSHTLLPSSSLDERTRHT